MFRHSLLILISLFVLPACQDFKSVAVKDFRIYADTENPVLKKSIKVLVNRYNKQFGSQALMLVDDAADSNSVIHFVPGLHDDGQKLGLGQWKTTAEQKTSMTIEGEKHTETVYYSMEIEFDEENFVEKAPSVENTSSDAAVHLYHLFCHEIGHGLQMDHGSERSSVMYPTIPEKATRYIDYESYFNRARSFMSSH